MYQLMMVPCNGLLGSNELATLEAGNFVVERLNCSLHVPGDSR